MLALLKSEIEVELNSVIYLANGLTTFIAVMPNSTEKEWKRMSAELIRNGRHIRNIGLAPNLEITFVYPHEGNEKAIGLKFRENQQQWPAVKRAIDSQKTVIAGPLILVQGGMALLARTPIFLDSPANTQLWGVSSIVINMDSLFEAINIKQLSENYQLSLSNDIDDNATENIFYGDKNDLAAATSFEEVRFPSGKWQISAVSKKLDKQNFLKKNAVRIAGYLLVALLLSSFIMLFKQHRNSHYESMRDPLTGLANRRLLLDRLAQMIHYHRRKKLGFTIINIDLNKFKPVNDNLGHEAGDAILKQVAKRLKQTVRASDTVARIGGDEFLLLMPELAEQQHIDNFVFKIKQCISEQAYQYKENSIELGASVGWSTYPEDGNEIEELLHKSDKRMYQNKYASRD